MIRKFLASPWPYFVLAGLLLVFAARSVLAPEARVFPSGTAEDLASLQHLPSNLRSSNPLTQASSSPGASAWQFRAAQELCGQSCLQCSDRDGWNSELVEFGDLDMSELFVRKRE